jgi:hypothetical protein
LLKKEADDASIELSDMTKPLSEEVKAPLSCSKKTRGGRVLSHMNSIILPSFARCKRNKDGKSVG